MINSSNFNATIGGVETISPRNEQTLSAEQPLFVFDTLSAYGADNLSQEDAEGIVAAFSEAGIQPGKSLEAAMLFVGFDAKAVGELVNVNEQGQGGRPPPPKQSSDEISSMVDYLAELLEEKLANNPQSILSDEDKQAVLAQVFEKFNIKEGDSIINTSA